MLSEEKRKELLEKRKYYREHPEEAKREYVKKFDGYGLIPVGVPLKSKKEENK